MWRPPAPSESPQDLGCHAIVCACSALLRDAVAMRRHWESGCFDCPEFDNDQEMEEFLTKWVDGSSSAEGHGV
jgi:hypothetical protein